MLNPIIKQKWLNALRSGKFKQGTGQLKDNDAYCCLGVLCKITGNSSNRDMDSGFPSEDDNSDPLPFCGLTEYQQKKLAEINDASDSFVETSNYIERYL